MGLPNPRLNPTPPVAVGRGRLGIPLSAVMYMYMYIHTSRYGGDLSRACKAEGLNELRTYASSWLAPDGCLGQQQLKSASTLPRSQDRADQSYDASASGGKLLQQQKH